jgi:hypothetical protein
MSKPTEFSAYVRRSQAALDMTNAEVADQIGTTGPNFSKWVNDNKFPRECIPELARVLNLEVTSPEEVEARFVIKWRRPYNRRVASSTASHFQHVLRQIDSYHGRAEGSIERLGSLTRQLFRHMSEEHFLVSSTSGASLLILNEKDPAGREQRENRFIALDHGLLWALITPSLEYWQKLKESYTIAFKNPYHTIKAGFDQLRADYIEHLRGIADSGDANAEKTADLRLQRLEWDDFPFTPPHWTVSLLGECSANRPKVFRAIVRAPHHRTYSYQLFPIGNQPFEYDLLRYFRSIIAKHYDGTHLKKNKNRDVAIQHQHLFCDALLKRMEES